jgi:hypothetical protein
MTVSISIAKRALEKITAFDNRPADKNALRAWADALDDDVTEADALQAVARHYATETRWIMPADVNRACRKIRVTRVADAEKHGRLYPEAVTPQEEIRWRRAYLRLVGAGSPPADASANAWRSLGRRPELESTWRCDPTDTTIPPNLTAQLGQIGAAS